MINKSDAEKNGIATKDGDSRMAADRDALRQKIQEVLPSLINSDGQLDIKSVRDAMAIANSSSNDQGYELTFAGKGFARAQASTPTEYELKAEPQQSKNFDETKNVVIRGDNIDVLRILYQNYFKKIKMIYIDPPYNTQKENFIYKDNFKVNAEELINKFGMKSDTVEFLHNIYGARSHSGWLTLMYPILKLARELLSDDGIIFISIDDNEQANLKIMCDEIFGENNFFTTLARKAMHTVRNSSKDFNKNYDFILSYAKKKAWFQEDKNRYIRFIYDKSNNYKLDDGDGRGKYKLDPLHARNYYTPYTYKFKNGYVWSAPEGSYPRYSEETLSEMEDDNRIVFGKGEQNSIVAKRYLSEVQEGQPPDTFLRSEDVGFNFDGTKRLSNILGTDNVFSQPKPTLLIEFLMQMLRFKEGVILDFFAGSGTTGDAVMQLNAKDGGIRKFIMVQLDEKIDKETNAAKFCADNKLEPFISSITIERLNRAGEKLKAEITEHNKTASDDDKKAIPDIGYKVYSTTLKPNVTDKAENEQVQLQLNNQRASVLDTLTNMLCVTDKTLDTKIECLIENVLYKAGDEIYLLGEIEAAKLEPHRDKKINLNGWADIDLEGLLNSGLHTKEEITVVY